MLDLIQNAYAFFDSLQVSVTGLVALMVVLILSFLFALREAASWFFKVNDLRREIARIREINLQLESEVRLIHNLIAVTSKSAHLPADLTADFSTKDVLLNSPAPATQQPVFKFNESSPNAPHVPHARAETEH
jgi:hypothetical protein